jgi:hypothetical protein
MTLESKMAETFNFTLKNLIFFRLRLAIVLQGKTMMVQEFGPCYSMYRTFVKLKPNKKN